MVINHLLTGMVLQVVHSSRFFFGGRGNLDSSGQSSSRPKTRVWGPQMVVIVGGKLLISGKSSLVKYYILARFMQICNLGTINTRQNLRVVVPILIDLTLDERQLGET